MTDPIYTLGTLEADRDTQRDAILSHEPPPDNNPETGVRSEYQITSYNSNSQIS